MLLAVRISSYGCTWEVWRALMKLELLSVIAWSNSYASFVLSKLRVHHYSICARQACANSLILNMSWFKMRFG